MMWVRFILLVLAALPIVGCSTHFTTLVRESDNQQVIYRISEERAFTTVLDAYAETLPKQSLYDITAGSRRGYKATWRWGLDTYSQKVLVIPAVATDSAGREVRGYWFEVSGEGSSGSGRAKNVDLYQRIQAALDATGAATVVTNVKEGRYETDGSAYRAGGQDAGRIVPGARRLPSNSTVTDQLRELKKMHDEGVITKEEYEGKRRQILERM
jgi:hypothetical protein